MARLISLATMVCSDYKRIGHNTYAFNDRDHNFALRYHSTYVVQYDARTETLIVNTGGWFSVTTAERIQHGLGQLNLRLSTWDLPGRWRVMDYYGNAFTIRGTKLILRRVKGEWVRVQ